ncbi:MAG: site-specific integrase [Deltaproteobacteria bacterium]|nr:site-specific integrase [Deltaproteobacteria bacterium]
MIGHLKRILGEATKIKDLTPGRVESYQQKRLAEESPRHPGQSIRPATVNKEVACLKTIFNRAVRHKRLLHNPIGIVKKLSENNVRMQILTQEEFETLLAACPLYIRPIVEIAYFMGLRRAEIINLTWPEVDLQKGFIRLAPERTKTDQKRVIPIHPKVAESIKKLPRGLHTDRVFLLNGVSFDEFRNAFKKACQDAGIQDFTFHDLRHCALNNLRLAGNDYFKIMALSGHKTMACFRRYNLVTEAELAAIKWTPEREKTSPVATNMDTKQKGAASKSTQPLEIIGRGAWI